MIDFDNTEIAFKSKSNFDLKRAKLLFIMMSKRYLQKTGEYMASTAMALRIPVKWAVKPTIYSQFVGGETIKKCFDSVRTLEKFNVKAILDYSVEGKESIEDINTALEETLSSIKNAIVDKNVPYAVFKPTAFTTSNVLEKASAGAELNEEEKIEAQNFKNRVEILCKAAYEGDLPILIDAEDTFFQNFIDETVDEMMVKYNKEKAIVYNTWQMYRTDRLQNLKYTYQKAIDGNYFLGAKFVRGAYMEKERERAIEKGYPSPIHVDKAGTDKAYNDALEFSFKHIDRVSIFNGTHNEESNLLLAKLMDEKGLKRNDNRLWFSQLFGMSDNISFILAEQGFNVAKYVPFGPVKHVLPYLFRRAEENTSVKGQTGRELSLINKEIKRRRTL